MKLFILFAFAALSLTIAYPIQSADEDELWDMEDYEDDDIPLGKKKKKKGGGITYAEWGSDSPFVTYEQVGYSSGESFSYYGGEDGSMLEKIGVYYAKKGYKGMKVWRTNGDSDTYGSLSGDYKEYSFENGEVISSMSMWIGKKKKRVCGIKFTTSTGGEFKAVCKKGYSQEYPLDVGSGVCVGVMGRSGDDIDALGFVFVKELSKSVMSNVNYPDIGITDANVHTESLKQVTYTNSLDAEQTFSFTDTVAKTTSEEWSNSNTLSNSFTLSIIASVPEVVEVGASYTIAESSTHTHDTSESTTTTEEWTYPVTVPANTSVVVTLEIGRADISLSYTATVTMTTQDGDELSFDISGEYAGVTYTDITLDIEQT